MGNQYKKIFVTYHGQQSVIIFNTDTNLKEIQNTEISSKNLKFVIHFSCFPLGKIMLHL